jgi:hypothetical protein
MGPMHWIREWGLAYGIYPWVTTLVMEIEGRRFWVERGCFFLGGVGEGKRNSRVRLRRRFRRTTRVPNSPVYVIYYIFRSGGFRCSMSSGHHEGGPRSSIDLDRHMHCSVSTTRRPSPHIEDGEGVVALRSATDSTEQWFCTQLEVWVLGVGMSKLVAQTVVHRGSGAPSTDGPGAWQHLIGPDFPSVETRQLGRGFQIGMFQSIRVDHTNCLQVDIKTHSFISLALDLLLIINKNSSPQ